MTQERLMELQKALKQDGGEPGTVKAGIGLGNIYKRIYSMYRDGEVRIESKEGEGTSVYLVIPQE